MTNDSSGQTALVSFGYEVFHPSPRAIARFYVGALGFEPKGEHADDGPEPDYLAVTRDGLQIGCSQHPDADLTPRRPPIGSEVVLRVVDVRAEYERVVEAGWPVEDELQRRPWGMTDFRLFDPTGQYIRVTSTG